MATLADILARRWPGARWSLQGDDYASLRWADDNLAPKPTEADLRQYAAEVDALMALEHAERKTLSEFLAEPGALLAALGELAASVADLQAKTGLADAERRSAVAALRARVGGDRA